MLCRFLLAAIAISCTFPRVILANDQGTPRALKDLVCVLFLSGIQKEDLEVSLLKKMQHYNIDYDKNNQDLRNECLNNTNSVRKANSDNKTTTKEAATTISTPTTIAAILDTRELQSVLKYLKHKKKIRNPPTKESSTRKTAENTEKVKHLFETLMSGNDDNVRKLHDIPGNRKEGSALDEINKYFLPFNNKLDQLISQTSNLNPINETSVNQTTQNEGNVTKENKTEVNKDNDFKFFKNIEQIGEAVAEYLSKKTTVAPETTTVSPKTSTVLPKITIEMEANVTKHPKIISQDIEQQFALSIAAINKLNENIAILQKHINGAMLFHSNVSNQSRGNVEKFENITMQLSDGNSQIQPDNTKYEIKSTGLDNYKYSNSNSAIAENVDFNIQVQSDHFQNSQTGFAYSVNNSIHTLPAKYDTSRFEKKYRNQPTPYLKDMIAQSVNDDKQKLPKQTELIYPAAPSSNSNSDMTLYSQKIKDITNYSYEKETIPENLNGEQNLKVDPNDPLIFIPRPQILPNVIDYGYYNTKQPTNNFNYNTDAAENVVMQSENQDMAPYNSNTKIVQDERIVDNNADINKNKQMQYPDATQTVQESIQNGFEKQSELDTQVIDIQSIINILKKKKLPLSIQNDKDKLAAEYYDGQKGLGSNISNLEESLYNANVMIMNKEIDNREQKKDINNPFSVEMISKIAETVKEIVLKDLKKQLISNAFSTASPTTLSTTTTAATTTPTTTTVAPTTTTITLTTTTPVTTTTPFTTTTTSTPKTTTTTISTSTSTTVKPTEPTALPYKVSVNSLMETTNGDLANKSQNIDDKKVQVATQTIEKFIQLFEQMKSAQEISMKINNKGAKFTGNNVLKPRYNVPPVVMFPPPPMNPFGMRVPKQMPIIVHNYIPPSLAHPPFPPSFVPTTDTKDSMAPINRPPSYIQPHFPHAVMIQTNTQEIQPLGIPLMKPEAMNMNIIVTTQNPYWSRDVRNRWNYIYGRKPDTTDVKLTNFNKVNTVAQANNNPIENKNLKNNKTSIDDNMRINILKQFDTYKKINAERNEKSANGIPSERIRYPSNNYINDSNFQDFINQMVKTNQQMFGVPYNNPMYNGYKISNINPNIMFGQLQNGGFSNQMFPYNQADSNILNKNGIQYGNIREKNTAQQNEDKIAPEQFSKSHFNTIINDQMNNLHGTYKGAFLKQSADSQTHSVDTMPTKDINNYSSQLKSYRVAENNQFNEMPSYRVKYSENPRPTFDHQIQNKPKYYLGNSPLSDGNKASFKNLEKYFDSPSRIEAMKMREKSLLKQARDYTKYKHSLGTGFLNSLDKIKKYENPSKYYSSPSDEDSNREFKKDKTVVRPYHGLNANIRLSDSNKQNGKIPDSQMDLINAVFRNRNRQNRNRDRMHAFDSDINSPYRSRVETSDIDTKGRTIQMESSDSDKYAPNVRGFHEKLESSDGWTEQSDCGPNEHCISSVKIMSRQQVPLDSKKPKYDDARFKNFLQKQEQVNRMLEMILSSKPDDGVDTI